MTTVGIRATASQRAAWSGKARRAGMSMTYFLSYVVDRCAISVDPEFRVDRESPVTSPGERGGSGRVRRERSTQMVIRVSRRQKARWETKARTAGVSLTYFITQAADRVDVAVSLTVTPIVA